MNRRSFLLGLPCLAAIVPQAQAADGWSVLGPNGIVLFRHANAPGVGDPPNFVLGDCSTQRILTSAEGFRPAPSDWLSVRVASRSGGSYPRNGAGRVRRQNWRFPAGSRKSPASTPSSTIVLPPPRRRKPHSPFWRLARAGRARGGDAPGEHQRPYLDLARIGRGRRRRHWSGKARGSRTHSSAALIATYCGDGCDLRRNR